MGIEIFFMTKSSKKNVLNVGVYLGVARITSTPAADQATISGDQ